MAEKNLKATLLDAAHNAGDVLSEMRGTMEGLRDWMQNNGAYLPRVLEESFAELKATAEERVTRSREVENALAAVAVEVAALDTLTPSAGPNEDQLRDIVARLSELLDGRKEAPQEA